jgi:cell division protein ZipA
MAELRWALLFAGLLLVVALVAWERRKRRARDGDRGAAVRGSGLQPPAAGGARGGRDSEHEPTAREEPMFSMPDLPRREPVRDLPIVEIDARTNAGPGVGDLPVFDMGHSHRGSAGALPQDGSHTRGERAGHDAHASEVEAAASVDVPQGSELQEPDAADPGAGPAFDSGVSEAREATAPDPVQRASAWLADSVPEELPQKPVLDWPPEAQRRIVALRVVPRAGEKFNGAALRQALVGEGFIHGELDIYHKPVGDGRVVLSAASLTRPGTFDPKTIDALLFGGLNLFAVLPGPMPPRDTVERLCLVGRTLAQRLRGEMLDSRGQPLTEARVAEMRREASDGAP